MRRSRPFLALGLLAAGLGAWTLVGFQASAAPAPDDEKTGGDTTVFATGRNAFSFPLANLPDVERTRFVIGNSFFRRNWVQAPASTTARDGLGPHFIARSCGGCHAQDGRGTPPDFTRGLADQPVGLLMRLSALTKDGMALVLFEKQFDLAIDPDQDYCTLVTCTPYGINTQRLLVRGHRIPNRTAAQADAAPQAEATSPIRIAVIVAIVVAVAAIATVVTVRLVRHRR